MNRKTVIILAAAGLAASLSACTSPSAPAADSDSSQQYANSEIPVDQKIYTISGEVSGQVNDLTRQVKPAQGSLLGINGYTSGSYFGPVESGKGFIRLRVASSDVDIAPKGELVVLKVSDTKGTALVEGDVVTFKCRKQYENIAAVMDNEKLDVQKAATWELDYCRLATPKVDVR